MGFPKRLLSDDEQLVLVLRRHVKVLLGPFVLLLLVAAAAGVGIGLVPPGSVQGWLRLAIGVVAGFVLLRWVVWPFLVWWNTLYAVTTRRLVMREGVFSRSGHDMPLTRLNDVSFEHSFWERLLGCGTLVVESAGERGQLLLDDIPKVELVQRTLYRLSDDAREHGGPARTGGVEDDLAAIDDSLSGVRPRPEDESGR